ncbi:hypothetical protein PG996_009068 [Apiospora saccharicola]|uniref:F-box domain-containing protein n=1 Tax=Apiospora saccharicola TaxID=335842 RepID=A0ABR1UJQ9_9PEZI
MASLQSLPDELLLEILALLPIDSSYCITKTCRVFRRLGYDWRFSDDCFYPSFPLKSSDRWLFAGSIARYQVDMGMFNPPVEQFPPWRLDWKPEDNLPMYESEQNSHMIPYDLRNDTHQHFEIQRYIGLLLKDTLCSPCYRFRHRMAFRQNMQSLMRPARCEGCEAYHPGIHFSDFPSADHDRPSQLTCIGRTRRFKMCAHIHLGWKEYQRASLSGKPDCKTCGVRLCSKSSSFRASIEIWKHPKKTFGMDEERLALLRPHLTNLDGYVCPHVCLNRADFVDYVLHNIRRCCAEDGKWCATNAAEMPLLDHSGKAWACSVCQTVAFLRYRTRLAYSMKRISTLCLIVSRPVAKFDLPSDSAWLAQTEQPRERRHADAHRVTWCEDPSCGTSRGGRKEALLIRMLETGMRTPERHPLYGVCPLERSQWLNRVFWWFWSMPDPAFRGKFWTLHQNLHWSQNHIARKGIEHTASPMGIPFRNFGFSLVRDETSPGSYVWPDLADDEGPEALEQLRSYVPVYKRKAAAALLAVTLGDFTWESDDWWPEQVVLENKDLYEAYITSEGQIYQSGSGACTWKHKKKIVGRFLALLGLRHREPGGGERKVAQGSMRRLLAEYWNKAGGSGVTSQEPHAARAHRRT